MKLNRIFYFTGKSISSFFKKSATRKIIGIILFFSVTIFILLSNYTPEHVQLRTDEVAQRDIQSSINATVIDEAKTQELRKQAAGSVQKVYQEDNYALSSTYNEINGFFNNAEEIITSEDEDKQVQLKVLLENINVKTDVFQPGFTTNQLVSFLLSKSVEDIGLIHQNCLTASQNAMSNPVTAEALAGIYEQINAQTDLLSFSPQAKDIIRIVVINSIRPNLIFNQEATDNAISDAIDAVQPVQKTIKAGEIIVRQGERVTAEQIALLEQLGIQKSPNSSFTFIGVCIFVFITFLLIIEFLRRYYKEILDNDMLLLLIGLIFIIILLITRFITIIKIGNQPEVNALTGYLAPVAAGSMLIAILIDNRLAHFLTMIMAIFVGLLFEGNGLFYAITAFIGGTAGIFQVYRVNQTSDLARAGLYIALANIATIITLNLFQGSLNLNVALYSIIFGVSNGILSAVLTIGILPYLESAFSITSMIKLLELANPNHYLLKRLLLEASGTYHHSLMVGNLAEASAESIGANPLLVRVGAYYHDIGKIKRPEYFVENQFSFDNPHEKIAPALSALIITSHVKEGVELAKEASLPQVIIDFIEQHHGTGLAKYFYNRALEEDIDGFISEDSFRYEGPKPESKELALVMLADSVEAAVRSLSNPTPEKIKQMVKAIVKDKLEDGQLDHSPLTLKDLEIVTNSFCKILEGVYHKRIEYPEVIVKEFEKRREGNGNNDN
ncbi:MAG: HDIG domain-containing protein [Syntrophomonadaceae bacterium]|nr:HDIG domain-containing protein [Syntrophomonadaceae bacterium]